MKREITVKDPLYGSFNLPSFLGPYINSPEFSRLSDVRLLNYRSIELAALSDVRRLSHTLGVLYLWSKLQAVQFDGEEMKALAIAAVFHDIGTPPFGHTIEYEMKKRYGLDHERIVLNMLEGKHHVYNLDHQIYLSKTVALPGLIKGSDLGSLVTEIISNQHPLAALLFGQIDLDNLDNVYRMAHFMGERVSIQKATSTATELDVSRNGTVYFSESQRELIEDWLSLRKAVYQVLLLSPEHRLRQAIFEQLIGKAFHDEILTAKDWFLTDQSLIERLRSKNVYANFFADLTRDLGDFEVATFLARSDEKVEKSSLLALRDACTSALRRENKDKPVYLSVEPLGRSLAKQVRFTDPSTVHEWSLGSPENTYSIFLASASRDARMSSFEKIFEEFANDIGIDRAES